MDLRQYYKKLHELESKMPEQHVLVVSLDAGDGGREGVITEVSRRNACQLILEGRAKRAEPAQVEEFYSREALRRDEFRRLQAVSKMQVQFVPGKPDTPAVAEGQE